MAIPEAASQWPILGLLQALPACGAAVVLALRDRMAAVWIGRIIACGELLLAMQLHRLLDHADPGLQFTERLPLLGYHVAADGITVLLALLGTLVVLMMALYELVRGLARPGELLGLILLVESAVMAQLLTLNLFWFSFAALVEVCIAAYLIGHWSTSTVENRILATTRFLQFQGVGLLMFATGTLILAWGHADATDRWSFDLIDLAATPLNGRFQTAAFFLLFYGLAVRTPLFPLHGWLPNVMHRGMVSIAPSLLLGVKLGIYGMLRFVMPLTGEAIIVWQPYIVGFAMVGVFYAAILAFLQGNLRRLLSFAVVSHTSLIVVGLFSLHPLGIAGAMLLAVNFGLAVTVMLFMVGFVFRRTHTTDLSKLGGLFERIPFIAASFLLGGLAIVGMPGTPGFDAAHLVLEASMDRFGALPTVATALGNVTAAGFLLYAFQRAFLAPSPQGESGVASSPIERTQPMEYLVGGLAVLLMLLAGWTFESWLMLVEPVTQAIALRMGSSG